MIEPLPGTFYTHYKTRGIYQVVSVARAEWCPEEVYVVYRKVKTQYDDPEKDWIRPIANFMGTVEYEGKTVKRFQTLT